VIVGTVLCVVLLMLSPSSAKTPTGATLRCAASELVDCAPSPATSTRWLAPDLGVEGVAFGVPSEGDADGKLVATRVVPHKAGQRYGWELRLRSGRDRVRVREVLTLPEVPATWGKVETSPLATLSADSRTATVEEETTDRALGRWWVMAAGDPPGVYQLRLYIEETLVGEATFAIGGKR